MKWLWQNQKSCRKLSLRPEPNERGQPLYADHHPVLHTAMWHIFA